MIFLLALVRQNLLHGEAPSYMILQIYYHLMSISLFSNARIKKKSLFFTFCSHIAIVWALCSKVFKGTPLNVLQLDWLAVCNSQGLV